jgi:hypothetical protein
MSAHASIRIGDRERKDAADRLSGHHAAGRLTLEELEERLEQAQAAVYARDLAALERDLPAGRPAAPFPGRLFVAGLLVAWVATSVVALFAVGHPVPPFFLVPLAIWFLARRAWGPWHRAGRVVV